MQKAAVRRHLPRCLRAHSFIKIARHSSFPSPTMPSTLSVRVAHHPLCRLYHPSPLWSVVLISAVSLSHSSSHFSARSLIPHAPTGAQPLVPRAARPVTSGLPRSPQPMPRAQLASLFSPRACRVPVSLKAPRLMLLQPRPQEWQSLQNPTPPTRTLFLLTGSPLCLPADLGTMMRTRSRYDPSFVSLLWLILLLPVNLPFTSQYSSQSRQSSPWHARQ